MPNTQQLAHSGGGCHFHTIRIARIDLMPDFVCIITMHGKCYNRGKRRSACDVKSLRDFRAQGLGFTSLTVSVVFRVCVVLGVCGVSLHAVTM